MDNSNPASPPSGQPAPAKPISDTPHAPDAPTQRRPEPSAPAKPVETTVPDAGDLHDRGATAPTRKPDSGRTR